MSGGIQGPEAADILQQFVSVVHENAKRALQRGLTLEQLAGALLGAGYAAMGEAYPEAGAHAVGEKCVRSLLVVESEHVRWGRKP